MKTDGFHVYMLNGQLLLIMAVPEFGNLTLESNLTIEGYPNQMMLDGDRLVISSRINSWEIPYESDLGELLFDDPQTKSRINNLVKYTVVDISDRSSPSVVRELYIEVFKMVVPLFDMYESLRKNLILIMIKYFFGEVAQAHL